jgi:hypothetical protein
MKVGSTFMVTQDATGTTTLVLDGVSADNAAGTLTCSQDEAETIYYKDVDNVIIYKSGAGGAGGHTIEDEGTPLTARAAVNFIGGGVTVTDNAGTDATDVTISAGTVGAQDLFLSAAAFWSSSTNGAASLVATELGSVTIQSMDFDPNTQESVEIQFAMPRNWNNGTITAQVYWTTPATSGNVIWGVQGVAFSNDDPFASGSYGTAQEVTDAFIVANDLHVTSATSAITIAGSPADSDMLLIKVYRKAADGSDTLNADARFLGVRITYTLDAATAQ